jgi:hypothetical protein
MSGHLNSSSHGELSPSWPGSSRPSTSGLPVGVLKAWVLGPSPGMTAVECERMTPRKAIVGAKDWAHG